MNFKSLFSRTVFALAILAPPIVRADATTELKALIEQAGAKIRAGKASAEDLAPELGAFTALRAKYRGEKTSAAARILLMEAALYGEVIGDLDQARPLFAELKKEFSGLPEAEQADQMLASLERTVAIKKARDALDRKSVV